jgi:hypothetical protein
MGGKFEILSNYSLDSGRKSEICSLNRVKPGSWDYQGIVWVREYHTEKRFGVKI